MEKGTLYAIDGTCYTGSFKNGKKNGHGSLKKMVNQFTIAFGKMISIMEQEQYTILTVVVTLVTLKEDCIMGMEKRPHMIISYMRLYGKKTTL